MFDRDELEWLATSGNPEGLHHTCTIIDVRGTADAHLYECDECGQRFVGMNQMLQHRHLMTICKLRELVNDLASALLIETTKGS